jgi:integrase
MAIARYQHGHIRRVTRSGGGFAWKYQYRQTDFDGVRRIKSQTFNPDKYPTEASVWKALEGQLGSLNENTLAGKIEYTMGQLCNKYLMDELPTLAWSTQQTNGSLVKCHIKPKWENTRLADIKPLAVKNWIDKELTFGQASKKRAKDIISRMLDLAMLWELTPTIARNPMQLVKVKGATKRQKPLTILTMKQFVALVRELPSPVDLIVFLIGNLGLRVSEALAFRWSDIDEAESTITVQRVFTHSRLKDYPKTDDSWRVLPLHPAVLRRLQDWEKASNPESGDEYIFPGSKGTPRSDSTMLQDYIKPAAKRAAIPHISYHPLRHSHKTWLAGQKVQLEHQKDLLGHADIDTTANVYGKTLTDEMRSANKLVVDALLEVEKETTKA